MHIIVNQGGHTFLLSSGQMCHYPMRAAASKYGKFAYSSAFGYSVPTGSYVVEAIGGDNMLAVSDDAGDTWKVRRKTSNARLEMVDRSPVLTSTWMPWADVSIVTYLVPPAEATPNWHLRVHHIVSKRDLKTSEGAFGLDGVSTKDDRELQQLDGEASEGRRAKAGEAIAVSRGGAVGIVEMHHREARAGRVLDEDANSNLTASRSVLPSLAMDIPAGVDIWLTTGVFAIPASVSGYQRNWEESWRLRPQIPDWLRQLMA